ncbi:Gfo/Idh/MocA family oxidoreductase [Parvularcula sp. ZS-1/3]|uniref:Gfo/Idh/MocA family oxidoreductase n=1 Tax=Parvularcula mediterranea TaxID=2732508 RepID=A0A7Y3RJN7_9PROT|nr:Gfo/Idh/MocA family oxidoreductase [Parvularcula mediterranea]NNU15220.1 Gfo/Idh/MocA family oxidoreductase [Parvularcula mediterranea]
MTDINLSRRAVTGALGAAAALPMLGGVSFAQGGAKAVGQPMPRGVRLPETPPPAPSEGSVGIAIVGLGGYALRQIMPAFAGAKHVHIAGLVSGNREKAEEVAAAYGLEDDQIYGYDNYADIAGDDRIDAVYIILPTGLHEKYTVDAFTAGKHVLCEKPMAMDPGECERMIAAGKRAGRRLMIGYRCHFEPFNLKAMEITKGGGLGPLRLIQTQHQYSVGEGVTPQNNWRFNRALAGGGPLEDYGIYGVQAALYLSGEMPTRISATQMLMPDDPRFTEIVPFIASQFTFPSGAAAQLTTGYNVDGLNRVDAWGSRHTLKMNRATAYSGQEMQLTGSGKDESLNPGDPSVQFAQMMDHFGQAVRDGSPILTGGEMGLRDTRLIEAIYRSADRERPVGIRPDGTMRRL